MRRPAMTGHMPSCTLRFRLVLVEAEVQPAAQIVARLRAAARDRVRDLSGERIGRADVVRFSVAEETRHVAPCGKADAERIGILGGVDDLIELGRVEAALEADLHRELGQRRRVIESAAAAEAPVAARNRAFAGHLTVDCFVVARHQSGRGRVERRWHVRHRVGLHDQRLGLRPEAIDDARENPAGYRPSRRRYAQPATAASDWRRQTLSGGWSCQGSGSYQRCRPARHWQDRYRQAHARAWRAPRDDHGSAHRATAGRCSLSGSIGLEMTKVVV